MMTMMMGLSLGYEPSISFSFHERRHVCFLLTPREKNPAIWFRRGSFHPGDICMNRATGGELLRSIFGAALAVYMCFQIQLVFYIQILKMIFER